MKVKWEKLISLILVSLMIVFVFTGCGEGGEDVDRTTNNTENDTSGGNSEKQTNEGNAQDSDIDGIGGWKPFEEKVTLRIPVYDRGVDGLPPVDNNYWTDWIQENFGDKWNINIEFEPIPRDDVMTKYSLLIAGGETPTLLMEYDYPKVSQWASEGAMSIIDLEEFSHVAPDYYQSMVDNDLIPYTELDGEIYFVCAVRPYSATEYKYVDVYRMDWLKKVEYDHVPTNQKEETDALNKIIEAGITDMEPIDIKLPTANFQANIYREFPLDEKEWAIHVGIDVAALPWEPVKQAIIKDNERWHNGFITKEFELNDDETVRANFIAGKTYTYAGYMAQDVDWLNAFYKNNPDAELSIGTVLYDDNNEITFDLSDELTPQDRSNTPYGMVIGFSSIASEEQLKAAWMYLEWMIQEDVLHALQYGIEGIHYTETDEIGYPIPLEMEDKEERLNYNDNKDIWCSVIESREGKTIEDSISIIAPQGLPQDFTEDMIEMYYEKEKRAKLGWIYPDPVFSIPIESLNEYRATLESLFQEYYTKLVKCDPDEFDDLYEDLSQEYLDAGYQEIMDEKLAAYEAGHCTKLPDKSRK